MTEFIAVDGEADKRDRYTILADSQGRTLYNEDGIPSKDAFMFLLSLPRKTELVCYGLNYDVNQWLKDVPRPQLEQLTKTGRTWWGDFVIAWIPSKMFSIRKGSEPGVTICEVFGYFQTSFVNALRAWGYEPPREIVTMKQRRGSFTTDELDRTIDYCHAECRLLVTVMYRLYQACVEANCVPKGKWIGAGSIATALFTNNGVKAYHAHDAEIFSRPQVEEFVLRAYYGGRVELYRQGWTSDAQSADIRSAYPSAAQHLPCLVDARVQYVKRYKPDAAHALWRCTWEIASGQQIAPFPVRLANFDICYPRAGSGVYHASEVRAARHYFGAQIRIIDGIVVTPTNDVKPLSWIPDVYKLRATYKRDGNYAEKALKLGLNSVYGKTAQGYGFGKAPPFQNYFWAGEITAATRAKALHMLLGQSGVPIMTATDGIAKQGFKPKDLDLSDKLGAWELDSYDRIATVQAGVYLAERDGVTLVKSRGFKAKDVDYEQMVEQFYEDPLSSYSFKSRRFIGIKVALHRKDYKVWRTWPDETRGVAFEVKNKLRTENSDGTVSLYPIRGGFDSIPYVPKQALYDDPSENPEEAMIHDDQPHMEG